MQLQEGSTFLEICSHPGELHSFQLEKEKQDEAAGAVCVCVCAL